MHTKLPHQTHFGSKGKGKWKGTGGSASLLQQTNLIPAQTSLGVAMNPAFKKFGKSLCEKISSHSALKFFDGFAEGFLKARTEFEGLVAQPNWYELPQADFRPILENLIRQFNILKNDFSNEANKKSYPTLYSSLGSLGDHILALEMLIFKDPLHNNVVNVPLLHKHLANFLPNINFDIKFQDRKLEIDCWPQNSEALKTIRRFHSALQCLGMNEVGINAFDKVGGKTQDDEAIKHIKISSLDPQALLQLAQFPITGDKEKAVKKLSFALHELFSTEDSFSRQMQDMNNVLESKKTVFEKLEEKIPPLEKEQQQALALKLKATTALEQYNAQKKDDSIDQKGQMLHHELKTKNEEYNQITAKLERSKQKRDLLVDMKKHYGIIANLPCPWIDKSSTSDIVNAPKDKLSFQQSARALNDLCVNLTQAKNDKSDENPFKMRLESFRWIMLNGDAILYFVNEKNLLELDASEDNKLTLSTTDYSGHCLKRNEKELFAQFLAVPMQRMMRYSLLFHEIFVNLNAYTIEDLSKSKVGLLNSIKEIENYFLRRNESINSRKDELDKEQVITFKVIKPQSDFLSSISSFFTNVKPTEQVVRQKTIHVIDDLSTSILNDIPNNLQPFGMGSMLDQDSFLVDDNQKTHAEIWDSGVGEKANDEQEELIKVGVDQTKLFSELKSSFLEWDKSLSLIEPDDVSKASMKPLESQIDSSPHEDEGKPVKVLASLEKPKNMIELSPDPVPKIIPEIKDQFELTREISSDSLDIARLHDSISMFDLKMQVLTQFPESKTFNVFETKADGKPKCDVNPQAAKDDSSNIWYINKNNVENVEDTKLRIKGEWSHDVRLDGYFIIVGEGSFESFLARWNLTMVIVPDTKPEIKSAGNSISFPKSPAVHKDWTSETSVNPIILVTPPDHQPPVKTVVNHSEEVGPIGQDTQPFVNGSVQPVEQVPQVTVTKDLVGSDIAPSAQEDIEDTGLLVQIPDPVPQSQAKTSPSRVKTFFLGLFNPSTWGFLMLLSVGLGIVAQSLVSQVAPAAVLDILMLVATTALPILATLWLISSVVYLGRLIAQADDNGAVRGEEIAPSPKRIVLTSLGMTLGLFLTAGIITVLAVGGIPSELSFIKPLFEVIGQFIFVGLKGLGLDAWASLLAPGSEFGAYLVAAVIIAAPVILTLIMAERFVTAHWFNEVKPMAPKSISEDNEPRVNSELDLVEEIASEPGSSWMNVLCKCFEPSPSTPPVTYTSLKQII